MLKTFKKWFFKTKVETILENQLKDAQRLALEQEALAEHRTANAVALYQTEIAASSHHRAFAEMYKMRVRRLESQIKEHQA